MPSRPLARQIATFAAVGVVNTAVYYALYLLFLTRLPYLAAHVLAFVLSMIGSFFLNARFTYRTRPTWRKFLLFPLTNATNFLMTTAGVWLIVDVLHAGNRFAPLLASAAAIPVTFAISRWVMLPGRPAARTPPRPASRPVAVVGLGQPALSQVTAARTAGTGQAVAASSSRRPPGVMRRTGGAKASAVSSPAPMAAPDAYPTTRPPTAISAAAPHSVTRPTRSVSHAIDSAVAAPSRTVSSVTAGCAEAGGAGLQGP